ncbi:hypothetical protein J1N35_021881 [Gossypium stocksii]|uniref:Uncharacterized protein n=1 Tax=Gossypium stocksii TaxID=47602 RepID=A0A9D4A2D7_9ROSI|nr:hypothetical protein J1N35_021881 [Gossypium stocksii]
MVFYLYIFASALPNSVLVGECHMHVEACIFVCIAFCSSLGPCMGFFFRWIEGWDFTSSRYWKGVPCQACWLILTLEIKAYRVNCKSALPSFKIYVRRHGLT